MTHRTTTYKGGWTMVELLVVIAIIAVLAALAIPVASIGIKKSHKASCLVNLRAIAMASAQWSGDNNQFILPGHDQYGFYNPSGGAWYDKLRPYLDPAGPTNSLPKALVSPGNPLRGRSYNMNNNIRQRSAKVQTPKTFSISTPDKLMVFGNSAETNSNWIAPKNYDKIPRDWFGDGTANFLFLDGHAESIKVDDVLPPKGPKSYIFTNGLPLP